MCNLEIYWSMSIQSWIFLHDEDVSNQFDKALHIHRSELPEWIRRYSFLFVFFNQINYFSKSTMKCLQSCSIEEKEVWLKNNNKKKYNLSLFLFFSYGNLRSTLLIGFHIWHRIKKKKPRQIIYTSINMIYLDPNSNNYSQLRFQSDFENIILYLCSFPQNIIAAIGYECGLKYDMTSSSLSF